MVSGEQAVGERPQCGGTEASKEKKKVSAAMLKSNLSLCHDLLIKDETALFPSRLLKQEHFSLH